MRKIIVLLDSRAEYGILKNTLEGIQKSEKLELNIVVTGTHLMDQYGYTVKEIIDDGFRIIKEIPVKGHENEKIRIPVEMGNLMISLSDVFLEAQPDILLLFGDRYEMLAAASVAVGMHIPIAHISGGESTEGAMDEQIRHAITKMAHIHYPGSSVYANNIWKMGEESWRIFDVGDPGIENIKNISFIEKSALESDLKIQINRKTLLVTYHPVTLEISNLEWQINNLIGALDNYDGTIVITYPNSDEGSEVIIRKWKEFTQDRANTCLVPSLGSRKYLSIMKYCGAVVGNSSSAIVEAPYLKVPVINIGTRQKGRIMADNILCCGYRRREIELAIARALSEEFYMSARQSESLYGEGNTSKEIIESLENIEINEKLLKKKLYWDE